MSDTSDRPSLNLGSPPSSLERQTKKGGSGLVIFLQLAICAALAWMLVRDTTPASKPTPGTAAVNADVLKATAMALEERRLGSEAARAWREYLDANPNDPERAQILYRVGLRFLEDDDDRSAIAAFIEAEQVGEEDEKLLKKTGPKIVECLRRLGLYGEVGRELSRRVEVDQDKDAEKPNVVATFAGEELTDADIDRMIERNVDRMIDLQGGMVTDEQRDQLLTQYRQPAMRQRVLQEILQRELFSRRARELDLDRTKTFQRSRRFMENELLASRFLEQEMAKIVPTDVDVEAYYRGHTETYRVPDQVSVIVLTLVAGEDTQQVVEGIQTADDFRRLVTERSKADENEAAAEPVIVSRGQAHFRLGETDRLFELEEGEWTKDPQMGRESTYLALVEAKRPSSVPPLEQVRDRVEADFRSRKQSEFMQQLSQDLMKRYDVRIHQPKAEEQ